MVSCHISNKKYKSFSVNRFIPNSKYTVHDIAYRKNMKQRGTHWEKDIHEYDHVLTFLLTPY